MTEEAFETFESKREIARMPQRNDQVIVVSLLIKGDDYEKAKNQALDRLNKWVIEDLRPPFPEGSLLFYSIIEPKDHDEIHTHNAIYSLSVVAE